MMLSDGKQLRAIMGATLIDRTGAALVRDATVIVEVVRGLYLDGLCLL